MHDGEQLWGRSLPPWTEASAPRLLALFEREAFGRAGPEREELAMIFQQVINIQFTAHRDWFEGLIRVGLQVDETASIVLAHLSRKAPRIWEAIREKTRGTEYKILLKSLFTCIRNKVLELVGGERRRVHRVFTSTDCMYADGSVSTGAFVGLATRPDHGDESSAESLLERLRAAEDGVIGDIVVTGQRQLDAVLTLYAHLASAIAAGRGIISLDQIPTKLRRDLSSGLHALIASRLIRLVQRIAADCAA